MFFSFVQDLQSHLSLTGVVYHCDEFSEFFQVSVLQWQVLSSDVCLRSKREENVQEIQFKKGFKFENSVKLVPTLTDSCYALAG